MQTSLKVVLLSALVILLCAGCTKSPEKRIIGEWQESGESESIQFVDDGTIIIRNGAEAVVGQYVLLDEGKIQVELGGRGAAAGTLIIGFRFEGDELELTGPGGKAADYTRITGRPKSDAPASQISNHSATVAKQQVSEGLNLSGGAKAAVTEYFMDIGELPATNAEAGLAPAEDIWGKFTVSVSVHQGVITVQYRSEGAEMPMHSGVAGKSLVLTPEPNPDYFKWSCGSPDIDPEFLPSACR